MSNRKYRLRLKWQDADRLISAAHSQAAVSGLTHNLYKYPARFSPEFASAAIASFSAPGDLIADPFVGGGTSLVEARASGRLGIGADISSLATFVSRTKTRVLPAGELDRLEQWFKGLPDRINLHRPSSGGELADWGYTRNLECDETWPIRKAVELAVSAVRRIPSKQRQELARCIVLRTAQWALDGRRSIPSAEAFRQRLSILAEELIEGSREFAKLARTADSLARNGRKRTICLHSRAEGLGNYIVKSDREAPSLVLTSPPYPGVHILYHRWQVRGGRETPAPFWISNQLDGAGEAYYLMHAKHSDLSRYYEGIERAFSSIARSASKKTTIVQLVAFSSPRKHLHEYLEVMDRSGFDEYLLSDYTDSRDGRIWRRVPGRKWHANKKGRLSSGREVVLIHKAR